MLRTGKVVDAVFNGAGVKAGLEIWCIENLQVVQIPKSLHGKFFSGSAYVILNTLIKSSGPEHDIHYWLGNDADEVESTMASDKALELDAALGSYAIQYREVQGHETEKFLSYFKPCIIPIPGKFSSGLGCDNETYRTSLLACKGDHVVYVKEVPFSRSSLNHNDVFIVDTAFKIYLFSGCNSSMQERAKALEVVQYINEHKHSGKCQVATIEDGKFVGDSDVGEFWSLFGGYAPITKDLPLVAEQQPQNLSDVKLFWITLLGKLSQIVTSSLTRELLSADKCYLLDCDTEIYVWMGRTTSVTERKMSISSAEEVLKSQGRSKSTHLTCLTEGTETARFMSYFDGWPRTIELNLYEEGRDKVAAIFKQQGYDVKELPEENYKPSIDCSGTLKVWRVDGTEISLLPVEKQNKLYSADCYIVQYKYHSNDNDEHLFYAWLGNSSILEDRLDTISHMCVMVDSIKGHPVMAQIFQGKEPIQFYFIFQKIIVLKGGFSSRYKRFILEKGIGDETYDEDKAALFRVQGTGHYNMQAIQVDLISGSLNSSYCYILQTGASIFTWIGNLSSQIDHDLLDNMLDLIYPTCQPMSVREGSEPEVFWNSLGGKAEYSREKERKGYVEEPHLFTCTIHTGGNVKVKEIFNFTQDDLTTEDILVLDCHDEIYVWIGNHSNVKSKQEALTIGMKYLENDVLVEGLSLQTPVYVIAEGHEPLFFTNFFEWDSSKMNMTGNSFERKLATLKGQMHKIESPKWRSWKAVSDATSDYSRSKSVGSNGLGRSAYHTSSNSGSAIETSNRRRLSSPPIARKLFPGSPDHVGASNGTSLDLHRDGITDGSLSPMQLVSAGPVQVNNSENIDIVQSFPYDRLKITSDDPVPGIDVAKREAYLSHEEFQEKFGMTKESFYKLPKWRQNKHKMTHHLF